MVNDGNEERFIPVLRLIYIFKFCAVCCDSKKIATIIVVLTKKIWKGKKEDDQENYLTFMAFNKQPLLVHWTKDTG